MALAVDLPGNSECHRWRINWQPDAPHTSEARLRPYILGHRSCSRGFAPKVSHLSGGGKLPAAALAAALESVPTAVLERSSELFAAAAYAAVLTSTRADCSKEDGAESCASSMALSTVRRRLLAARRGRESKAPAGGLAELLAAELFLQDKLPPGVLNVLCEDLRSMHQTISLSELDCALARATLQPAGSRMLRDVRRWVLCFFGGDSAAALVAARSHARGGVPDGDAVLFLRDWKRFLEAACWPHGESEAEQCFAVADFRGQGCAVASELLFGHVCACRRWLFKHVGTAAGVLAQLEVFLSQRPKRQRALGLVGAQQWAKFLEYLQWPGRNDEACAIFRALDVHGHGELASVQRRPEHVSTQPSAHVAMALPPPSVDRLCAVMADGSDALTFGAMIVRVNRVAWALAKTAPENIVSAAIYSKNSVQWIVSRKVCTLMGLRCTPINWHLAVDEVAYIVDDCDADVVFFGADFVANVRSMQHKAPNVKTWVCMDGVMDGAAFLNDLVNQAPVDAQPPAHQRKTGMAVLYTGGSSGKPKGVVRSEGKASATPQSRKKQLEELGALAMMPDPVQLVIAPLYHAMPTAWLSIGLTFSHTFVLMPQFDARAALKAIDTYKVTGFFAPPILLKRLLQLPPDARSQVNISSVRNIISSGAACPSIVKTGIVAMFGQVLRELYGSSELASVTIMTPEHLLKKPLSCGRPAEGVHVILLDDNRKEINEVGVAGEIFARGNTMDGYHKQAQKTQETKYGDYMSVGDVGYFDEDGFLYISDRKTDMVISGGVNIYPAAVEEVLHRHPDLEDVAVFGIADEEFGERVHAALKPRAGHRVTAREILAWCDGKIGKFQLPKEADISFHAEDFPRSEAGKLRKKALKAQVEAARRAAPPSRL